MAQSTWIALALVALFFVYVTARGELPAYLATVIGPYPAGGTAGTTTATGSPLGMAGQAVGVANQAVSLAEKLGVDFGGTSSAGGASIPFDTYG